jgi:hypothetical protein
VSLGTSPAGWVPGMALTALGLNCTLKGGGDGWPPVRLLADAQYPPASS